VWKTLLATVALLCTVAAGVTLSPADDAVRQPELVAALRTLPAATLTANFTDWSAVRSAVDAPEVSPMPAPRSSGRSWRPPPPMT